MSPILIIFFVVLFILIFPALLRFLAPKAPPEITVEDVEKPEVEEAPPPKREASRPHVTQRVLSPEFELHPTIESREFKREIEKRELENRIDPHFREEVTSDAFSERGRKPAVRKKAVRGSFLKKMVIYSLILERPRFENEFER